MIFSSDISEFTYKTPYRVYSCSRSGL